MGGGEEKLKDFALAVVNEVTSLLATAPVQPLVFQDAIHEGPAGTHARALLRAAVDRAGENPQRLGVALETAMGLHHRVERPFARVAERRMPDVMGETD